MKDLLKQVKTALAPYQQSRFVFLGCSGGLDSVVLFHLLVWLRDAGELTPELKLIHVNHGLSPNADSWADFVAGLADKQGVPFILRELNLKLGANLEERAREARYRAFEDYVSCDAILLTAHHQDDQVETFFQRLLRGAGIKGLSAMREVRSFGQGQLVRPLLNVARADLLAYAKVAALEWIEDESNAQLHYQRNKLRHGALSRLAQDFPQAAHSISQSIAHLQQANTELRLFYQSLYWQGESLPASLEIEELLALAPWMNLSLCVRQWLEDMAWPLVEQKRLEEFVRQAKTSAEDRQPRLILDDSRSLYASQGVVYAVDWQELEILRAALQALPLPLGWHWHPASQVKSFVLFNEDFHRHTRVWLKQQGLLPWWREGFPLLFRGEELLAFGHLRCFVSGRTRAEQDFVKAWHQLGASWLNQVDFIAPK